MKIFLFVLLATVLEASGDAILRVALLGTAAVSVRVGLFLLGAALLTAYGTSLNLAPVEFASVVGLYVALLFVMFQITNYLFFKVLPTTPVLIGGALVIAGGLIVFFGSRANPALHH